MSDVYKFAFNVPPCSTAAIGQQKSGACFTRVAVFVHGQMFGSTGKNNLLTESCVCVCLCFCKYDGTPTPCKCVCVCMMY